MSDSGEHKQQPDQVPPSVSPSLQAPPKGESFVYHIEEVFVHPRGFYLCGWSVFVELTRAAVERLAQFMPMPARCCGIRVSRCPPKVNQVFQFVYWRMGEPHFSYEDLR